MTYVEVDKEIAVRNEIIKETSFFPTDGKKVIFKKDILTAWSDKNKIDFEYREINTQEALKLREEWQQI
ncbi:hypothetical protein HX089_16530 [Myroides odoratimimus]|uniref:hypothetical protein n=1 Tax=Myroides odoratimimus TaxID=76832 RepID=UPI0025751E7B|nr:hypothetical protein [Myroides odoratimimus]MDM1499050.1 hypothetical protein [Myroides odoratimimus]MDM1507514.1 hypothetical protein [Myroides odoratimimus]MDM1517970.1 hypothetical protein [Myroides odoratimimus]